MSGAGSRSGLVCLLLAAAGCLEAPTGAGGGDQECPGPEAPPRDPTLGDVITFTFDRDDDLTEVVHDRSGNRLDGALERGTVVASGYYGLTVESTDLGEAMVEVPPHPLLHLGDQLTLEMWVWRLRTATWEGLVSVFDPELARGELILEIQDDGGVWFGTAAGDCADPGEFAAIAPPSSLAIEANAWVHLAVTRGGDEVRFYKNGALAFQTALAVEPCEMDRPLYIGSTAEALLPFQGWLDDVKISSYPKSAEEIVASMNHDPTMASRCGDGVVDAAEDCEPPALCCDPLTCRHLESSCDCRGTCEAGLCTVDEADRVDSGLVARYDFEEGDGAIVGDSGGSQLDLSLGGSDRSWGDGSLVFGGTDAAAVSSSAATAIVDACKASNEFSLEAWVTPHDLASDERVIALLGLGDGCQGAALIQERDRLAVAFATSATEPDGEPHLDTPEAAIGSRLIHAVATRSADGLRRLYVDGRLASESRVAGDLAGWDPAQRLVVGGPVVGVSPSCEGGEAGYWQGEIHRLAIYARALTAEEVAGNFLAGPQVAAAGVR